MPRTVLAAVAAVALISGAAGTAMAQEEAPSPPHQEWSFNGVFGTYDQAALQRGFQVYKEVCSACHPVKHLYFRDLTQIGYSEDQVKGIAAQYQVTDGPNDQGQMYQRPARPSDPIPGPFPNDEAARAANNGALAAGSVADHQSARRRRRLRLCDPDRLQRRAGRVQGERGHVLQRILPRPPDRDAAAAQP